jgi:tetratricopeptide (TPR) repeat protein
MSKAFALQLIEHPGDETARQLFRGRIDGVFHVDWREADDDIVGLAAACIGGGGSGGANELRPQWIDGTLHVSFRGKLTPVPLEFRPGEQDTTLLALNRALAPELEVRHIRASEGGDTAAFMVLRRAEWSELDAAHGSKVDAAFGRIGPDSSLFAPGARPVADTKLVAARTRASLSLERVKEGRILEAQKKFAEAVGVFDDVVQRYGDDEAPAVRSRVLMALVSKGIALTKQNRPLEAIAAYADADRRFGRDTDGANRDLLCSGLFNKSLCLNALKRTGEELALLDEIDRRFGGDEDAGVRESVISALRNKAFRLGQLGQLPEQTALYDLVVQRFAGDGTAAVRAKVALSLSGAAYSRMLTAKQRWADRGQRTVLLRKAIADLRSALETCEKQWRVMVLGNLGYALFLAGEKVAAARDTEECLRLGGNAALEGQRSDAATHRVEQVDADYEDMLSRVWSTLSSARR